MYLKIYVAQREKMKKIYCIVFLNWKIYVNKVIHYSQVLDKLIF